MMAVIAAAIVIQRNLFAVVVLGGIYSFLMATALVALDAVDVAMTEASVGAGIALGSVVFDSVSVWTVVASIWLVGGSMGFVFGSATTLAVAGPLFDVEALSELAFVLSVLAFLGSVAA